MYDEHGFRDSAGIGFVLISFREAIKYPMLLGLTLEQNVPKFRLTD